MVLTLVREVWGSQLTFLEIFSKCKISRFPSHWNARATEAQLTFTNGGREPSCRPFLGPWLVFQHTSVLHAGSQRNWPPARPVSAHQQVGPSRQGGGSAYGGAAYAINSRFLHLPMFCTKYLQRLDIRSLRRQNVFYVFYTRKTCHGAQGTVGLNECLLNERMH